MDEICFEEIILSDEEFEALEVVSKAPVWVESGIVAILKSLQEYGLVAIAACAADAPARHFGAYPKSASITSRGKAYLAYAKDKKSKWRSRLRRDVIIAFISGASGFLLSELFRLLSFFFGSH